MRRLIAITLLAACTALAACANIAEQRKSTQLQETLSAYRNALRWGSFQQAAAFIDPKLRQAHPMSDFERSRYAQVRVSDYDDAQGPVPAGKDEVHQAVRIGLINRNTQAERSIVDQQVWHYDQDAHHWWLESGLPDLDRR
ncbi:hypothetical protein [Oleiagrimonas sp. C23AA]|uniref:hypothetical protein n=1 Tax=Oleiagrimonas sp. C23AA TaxID=2719047 RepID=UPI0014220374|nr:hypothetical protein [Oleiagrimonas sp. C23AA]NII12325.1 hypothetical protein [Oleiagrimonas sp. C23AA]